MSVLADIALFAALLAGLLLGYYSGAARGVASLLCFLFLPRLTLATIGALSFTSALLSESGAPNSVMSLLVFYSVLFALVAAAQFIALILDRRLRPLLSRSAKRYLYNPAGALTLAAAFFLLFSILFSTFAGLIPRESQVHESLAARSSARGMELMALPDFHEVSWEELYPGGLLIPPRPESHRYVELPPGPSDCQLRADMEMEMLGLVNAERTERGLRPLSGDPVLTKMARDHSLDMCERRYFSHYSPEGEDVAGRARKEGLSYRVVGENLALSPDLISAHEGLMESPGHRQNILSPEYSRIGIGIYHDGTLGLMVTQNFAD
jgi:uncharacterized protein YkwD